MTPFTDPKCAFYWVYIGLIPMILCASPDGYQMAMKLADDKLGSDHYNANLRPVLNNSDLLTVTATVTLMSVVEIDDVEQKFVTNAFMLFCWTDQVLKWNPQEYDGIDMLTPSPKEVWRPRLILLNTLTDRDPFEDDHSPFIVSSNGEVCWAPGALFTVSCQLDMKKYPFDTQTCSILLCSMSYFTDKVQYQPGEDTVDTHYYQSAGEWILDKSYVTAPPLYLNQFDPSSCIDVKFKLQRRSDYYVSTIILPIVFISFLNVLVFVISDIGRISFGITVLLSMSVLMSMVSTMVPRSSEARPALMTYLMTMLAGAVLSVIASILTVYLHRKYQTTENSNTSQTSQRKGKQDHQEYHHDTVDNGKPKATTGSAQARYEVPDQVTMSLPASTNDSQKNEESNCSIFARHVDKLFFIVFFVHWVGTNLWYALTVV